MRQARVLFVMVLLSFLVSAGLLWQHRAGLERLPGDAAYPVRSPQSAFLMPDGGIALVDSDSERIARFNAAGLLRWELRPGTLFGRFLAVEAAPEGGLYAIDEIARPAGLETGKAQTVQRLVRISQDGSLEAVLLERELAGSGGFIPASLCLRGGGLWYLYDDGSARVLARFDTATLQEEPVAKTDWIMDRASLAPGEAGGGIAVATEGGLALFKRNRFETLSEYGPLLPFPAWVRYDEAGSLYVADPVAGLLLRVAPGLRPEVLVSASALAEFRGALSVPGYGFDHFSVGPEGLVFVDKMDASVLVVDPAEGVAGSQAWIVKRFTDFRIPQELVRRSLLAWLLLSASLVFGLLLLALMVYWAASLAPKALAMLGAALPGLAGLALVTALAWHSGELHRLAAAEAAGLERLRAAAAAGAGALSLAEPGDTGNPSTSDPARLSGPVSAAETPDYHPRYSAGWERLRGQLAAMVSLSADDGWPPVSAVLYYQSEGVFRYLCDSGGQLIPGVIHGPAPAHLEFAASLGRAVAGAVDKGGRRWLASAAPLRRGSGETAILLEMVSPAFGTGGIGVLRLLEAYLPVPKPRVLALLFTLSLALLLGLPLLVLHNREGKELRDYQTLFSVLHAKKQAVMALREGNPDKARRLLLEFAWREPLDTQVLNNLGTACARLGRLEEALPCFEAVLRLQADNSVAKANMATIKDRLDRQPVSSTENRR